MRRLAQSVRFASVFGIVTALANAPPLSAAPNGLLKAEIPRAQPPHTATAHHRRDTHALGMLGSCTGSGESISPCTQSDTLGAGGQTQRTFTVVNNSIEEDFLTTGCTVSGAAASCSVSPASLDVPAGGASRAFTVTFHAGNSPGAGTVTATAVGNGDLAATITLTVPPPPTYAVSVTPDSDRFVVAAGASSGVAFFVRNTGTGTATFADSAMCTNTVGTMFPAPGCFVVPDTVHLAPNQLDTVIVAWTAGAAGAQGRVRLKASQKTPTGTATDTGWVNVLAYVLTAKAPVVDVAGENPGTTVRRDLCLTMAAGEDAASECGDLRIAHPLPSVRTMNKARSPDLLYNSQFAHPHPVIAANVSLGDSTLAPDTLLTILTVNGVTRDTVRWKGHDFATGTTRRVVLGYDALADSSKVGNYVLTVTSIYNSPSARFTAPAASGTLLLVNRAASPFGAGWWLAGLEQLFFPSGDSTILWVGGDGSATLYHKSTLANTWTGTSVDRPDTLKFDGTNYVRYLRHGLQVRFNSAGQHVATINRLKHVTTFSYTGGLLTGIQVPTPAGGATVTYSLAYTSGHLSSVSSPGPKTTRRTSTIYVSKAKVDSILDPDLTETTGYKVLFGYTGSDSLRITSRSNERRIPTYFFYDAGSKISRDSVAISHGPSIVDRFRNIDSLGLASAPMAVNPESAYVRINGPRRDTTVTTFWLDRFGAPRKISDAFGAITSLSRTDARWPASVTRVQYANGRVLVAAYNARGTEDSVVDSATVIGGKAARTKYKWDARWDFADTIVAPAGETTTILYDTVGNREWQQLGPSSTRRVTFTYDPSTFLLRTVKSPLTSGPDSVSYDAALGDLAHTASPYRYAVNLFVDGVGRDTLVKTQIDSGGTKWLWQRTTYDDDDRQLTATTSGGKTSLWNGTGGIYPYVDSATVTVSTLYDSAGNVLSVTRQAAPDSNKIGTVTNSWTYDEANRRLKEIAPDGKADSMTYDAAGNVVSWVTRRGGAPILVTYDALNRRATRLVPAATYAETTMYAGFLAQTTFPHYSTTGITIPGDTAVYTYDLMGNLVGALNRDAIVRRTYNQNGSLRTDSLRIRTYAELSAGGDTTSHRYGLTFGYDLEGRRIWMHVDSILAPRVGSAVKDTIRYAYDTITGVLTTVTDVIGSSWRYAYDAAERVDSMFCPGGGVEVQTFDGEGRDSTRVDRLTTGIDTINNDLLLHDARDHVVKVKTNFDTTAFRYAALGAIALSQNATVDGTARENAQWNMDGLGNMFEEMPDFNQNGSLHTYLYEPHTGRLRRTFGPEPGMNALFDTSTCPGSAAM